MENGDVRINKITVNVDKYDSVRIALYKTNELIGALTEEDLNLPLYSESGVSKKAYLAYVKDFTIELMNIGGIPGYYYEPKSEGDSIKYDPSVFRNGVGEYIGNIIGDKYEFQQMLTDRINIIEQYKDKYIKEATGEFDIKLTQFDITITVISEIKSGQLCRPRTMMYDGNEYSFNVTNVGRIIKSAQ